MSKEREAAQELAKDIAARQRQAGKEASRQRAIKNLEQAIAIGEGRLPHGNKSEVNPVYGDIEPSDILLSDNQDPDGVTKVRTIHGFKVERRNPHGFWFIVDAPKELSGAFTSQEFAQTAIDAYVAKTGIKTNE